jgi:hypothetical protein
MVGLQPVYDLYVKNVSWIAVLKEINGWIGLTLVG